MKRTASFISKKQALFINRNFALLWCGQVISMLGDYVFTTTLTLWIVTTVARGQSWASLAVSGLLIASTLPTFLIGPFAGVFIDRWEKRRTLVWMDALQALLILFLLLVTILNSRSLLPGGHLSLLEQLGITYIIVFCANACGQFFNPSLFALFGDIVDESYRTRASSLLQTMASLALIIGPPVGTVLFFAVGVYWSLALNAFSFLVSLAALLFMHMPQKVVRTEPNMPAHFFREFREGIHFFAKNRILVALLVTTVLVLPSEGALSALNVFFVTQNLHTPLSLYGFLNTAIGVGVASGAALSGFIAQRIGVARTFWLPLSIAGVVFLAYGRVTSFVPALALLFCFGLLAGASNVVFSPISLHVTPREFIGRVSSIHSPALNASYMLSLALVGYLDSTLLHGFHTTILGISFGPVDTIFTVTGVLAILGGFYSMIGLHGVKIAREAVRLDEQKQEGVTH